MKLRWFAAVAVAVAAVVALSVPGNATIAGGKHDFRGTGSSTFKGTVDETCYYCHAPHNPQTAIPLWNHTNTATASFTIYTSTTLQGTTGQPGSTSLMCLSCHDGTVAIDAVAGAAGTSANKIGSTHSAYVGTDLSNDHPVGITYDDVNDTGLRTANGGTTGTSVTSGSNTLPLFSDKVECASCHEPHGGASGTKFLRIANTGSALCIVCHLK